MMKKAVLMKKLLFITCMLTGIAVSGGGCSARTTSPDTNTNAVEIDAEESESADSVNKDSISEDNISENIISENIQADQNMIFEDELYSNLTFIDENTWVNEEEKYQVFVDIMTSICNKYGLLNGSFMLATDDEVIFNKGMNSTQMDGTTVNSRSVYEIGSLTKTFTATAILQQVQAGNISLDDPVSKYIPEFEKDITVYQLLHMRSGLIDYVNMAEKFLDADPELSMDEKRSYFEPGFMTDERFINYLNALPVQFEADEKFEYSNTNYHLLAMILEKATGKTFQEYVNENIASITGMTNTSCATIGDVNVINDKVKQGDYMKTTTEFRGCMDMHSSAEDILLFDRALLNNELFNEEMSAEMVNMVDAYGCGMIEYDENYYGHTGATFTFGAVNNIYKSNDYGNVYLIALFPNKTHTLEIREMSQAIYEACK